MRAAQQQGRETREDIRKKVSGRRVAGAPRVSNAEERSLS